MSLPREFIMEQEYLRITPADLVDFAQYVLNLSEARKAGTVMSKRKAAEMVGGMKNLEDAIRDGRINPIKSSGNRKWKVLADEVIAEIMRRRQ